MYTDGILVLTLNDIRAMYPNTSFPPQGPSETWLNNRGLYFLVETPQPSVDWDEVAYEDGVEEVSSEWRLKWSVRDKTPEEIEDHHAMIRGAISSYRESLEQTIVEYDIHSSYCDKESVTGIDECINNIMDNGGDKFISWEGPNEYLPATLEGLSGLRKTVVDYRQKTRDAERLTLEDHLDTPFNTSGDAITAFNGHMEE